MSHCAPLSLTDIEIDEAIQPRLDGLNNAHIAELQESGPEAWPPIVVVEQAGRYTLIDGRHRLEAARQKGLVSIAVEVRATPDDGDLQGVAFALNTVHGRPLTSDDRKAEAKRLLHRSPALSSRQIAERCGLSHNTVEKIRGELTATGQIDQLHERVGADGKKRPAKRCKKDEGVLSQAEPTTSGTRKMSPVPQPKPTIENHNSDLISLLKLTNGLADFLDERGWSDDQAADDLTEALFRAVNGRQDASDLQRISRLLEIVAESYKRVADRLESTAPGVVEGVAA